MTGKLYTLSLSELKALKGSRFLADVTVILITRYRPRGIKKANEPWDEWIPDLGPSPELHKTGAAETDWIMYRAMYHGEQLRREDYGATETNTLVDRIGSGESIALVCHCKSEGCHRFLLREIIDGRLREWGAQVSSCPPQNKIYWCVRCGRTIGHDTTHHFSETGRICYECAGMEVVDENN